MAGEYELPDCSLWAWAAVKNESSDEVARDRLPSKEELLDDVSRLEAVRDRLP